MVGLPLMEAKQWIVIGAEVLGHPRFPANGAQEHPAKCETIDGSCLNAKPDDPSGVLVHDHQDPMGPQDDRFASEQIDTPEAVFHLTNEGQPGRTTGVLSRTKVAGKNSSNNIFVDGDVKGQGNLLSDSRTAPSRITLLHLNDCIDELFVGPHGSWLAVVLG